MPPPLHTPPPSPHKKKRTRKEFLQTGNRKEKNVRRQRGKTDLQQGEVCFDCDQQTLQQAQQQALEYWSDCHESSGTLGSDEHVLLKEHHPLASCAESLHSGHTARDPAALCRQTLLLPGPWDSPVTYDTGTTDLLWLFNLWGTQASDDSSAAHSTLSCLFCVLWLLLCLGVLVSCVSGSSYLLSLQINNNNRIQRHYSSFYTISSQRCKLSPTHTIKWTGRNRVQLTCNTSSADHMQVSCYVPLGTKGQLSY